MWAFAARSTRIRCWCGPSAGLWAVADGMGGHEAGDVASAKVADALLGLPIVYGLDDLVEARSQRSSRSIAS